MLLELFILLKIENNKKKNKKITVHASFTVHLPICTIHISWTVQETLV